MGGSNPRRRVYHRKEKIIKEGRKWKSNQVRNRLNYYLRHPPQGESSLLVVIGVWIGPFILEMAYGLSIPIMVWGRSLDQGSSAEMNEAQEVRENHSVSLKVDKKMIKLISRGYITEGGIIALTSLSSVPRVTYDICMVFDTTLRRLNNFLWDPKFMLLSMGSLLMIVGTETIMVDLDVGEMFYNFQVFSALANYCRVDMGSYMGHKKD